MSVESYDRLLREEKENFSGNREVITKVYEYEAIVTVFIEE